MVRVAVLLMLSFAVAGCNQYEQVSSEEYALILLTDIIKAHEQRVDETVPIYFNKGEKGWAQWKMKMLNIRCDVTKVDSCILSYTATVEFGAGLWQTDFVPTKEDAEATPTSRCCGAPTPCRLFYAIEDGAWAMKSRQYYDLATGIWKDPSLSEPDSWPTALLLQIE